MSDPVALHFEIDGAADGPALVLAGSLGTTLAMWEPQRGPLSARARLIVPDHRGHGGSPVPEGPYEIADLGRDVLALLDRLELERASFCGLSIGGMVGQWLAINAPERIERLILICTAAHVPGGAAFRARAETVRAAGPGVVADPVVGRWFTGGFAAAHPELVASYRAMIAATAAEGYASCAEAVGAHDVRAGLGRIRAPTLVISGAEDESLPPALGREIAGGVAGARFELLDPAAHLANVERADVVNELIAEHLWPTGGT
jgi:3-oxoadipate enol-lactonase